MSQLAVKTISHLISCSCLTAQNSQLPTSASAVYYSIPASRV